MEKWATFDCYGTQIDWNGGIGRELERLFGPARSAERHVHVAASLLHSLTGLAGSLDSLVS